MEPGSPGYEEPFVKPGSWMEKGFEKIDSVLYVTDGFARFSELLSINSEAINEAFFSILGLFSEFLLFIVHIISPNN